jgi:hypothetical protein
MRRI